MGQEHNVLVGGGHISSNLIFDIFACRVRMYTLLSGLYKYMFRRDEYCILILGLDNAGKTVCSSACLVGEEREPSPLPHYLVWFHVSCSNFQGAR